MNRLKEARLARGMTRRALAVAAGCSSSYVGRLEREPERQPTLVVVRDLARALGVTVEDLYPPEAGA